LASVDEVQNLGVKAEACPLPGTTAVFCRVAPGDVIDVDLRDRADDSAALTFDRVLAVGGEGDAAATIGTPYVDGAAVSAEVIDEIRDRKVDVIKFKRRKGYRRKQGHRQSYLRVKITDISS